MTVMMASHWNGVDVYDPLYENVSHLHTLTVGQEVRAWAPPEVCLCVLIPPSRGDGTAHHFQDREMEME